MLNTEYVQELMDDHGWTLGQLSTRSGISKAQLSRLFRDKRGAGAKTMEGILHAFPEADKEKIFFVASVTKREQTRIRDEPGTGNKKKERLTTRPARRVNG